MVSGAPVEPSRVKVTVEPTVEPVTVRDLADHLRISGTDQDAVLYSYLVAARRWCERAQDRAYLTQTRTLTLEVFPDDDGPVKLPGAPLQSITSIAYTKKDATSGTVSSSDYHTDTASEPGRAVLKVDKEWPTDDLISTGGVVVTYKAGHAFDTATVTMTIAAPGVVTWTAHGLADGSPVYITTTGALPTGLTAGKTYYVTASTANTFQLADYPGAVPITTTGTQSGTHTAYSTWRVPSTVKHAIKLLAGHWFENREAVADQSTGNLMEVPIALKALIENDTVWRFA